MKILYWDTNDLRYRPASTITRTWRDCYAWVTASQPSVPQLSHRLPRSLPLARCEDDWARAAISAATSVAVHPRAARAQAECLRYPSVFKFSSSLPLLIDRRKKSLTLSVKRDANPPIPRMTGSYLDLGRWSTRWLRHDANRLCSLPFPLSNFGD
jgi:hypothetical protein